MSSELAGRCIVSFERRRREGMEGLIAKRGGVAWSAPALEEVPLEEQTSALTFGQSLFDGQCDVLVLLTGVGTEMLVDAMSRHWARDEILAKLAQCQIACRGPKPVAVLKKWGLRPVCEAPSPNTWRELLGEMQRSLDLSEARVFVQEYGDENVELTRGLEGMAKRVTRVPVYAWKLPEDTSRLEEAVTKLTARDAYAVVFTSAQQVRHLFQVADAMGQSASLREGLADIVVASIGPVTSEVLERYDVSVDVTPDVPKMGQLAAALAKYAARDR